MSPQTAHLWVRDVIAPLGGVVLALWTGAHPPVSVEITPLVAVLISSPVTGRIGKTHIPPDEPSS